MQVIIGEDEALLRRGLQLVLEDAGLDVVAVAADAQALMAAVEDHVPDLVVTDIRMPPTHTNEGLVAALQIRKRHSMTAVVVLSQHVQRRYARELLATPDGRIGYLLKQRIANVEAFIADIRSVAAGGTALDPDIVAVMLARARHSDAAVQGLTPRQQEVLALMAEGKSNSRIASELFLSEKAVVQHASNIYDTLRLPLDTNSHRRVLAVMQYLSQD